MPENQGRTVRNCVPTATIRDIIRRERGDTPQSLIAAEIGCDEAVVRRILNPEDVQASLWMDFDKADRILTKLGLNLLWHTEPSLREVYEYLDGYEAMREEKRLESLARKREKTAQARAARKQRLAELRGQWA